MQRGTFHGRGREATSSSKMLAAKVRGLLMEFMLFLVEIWIVPNILWNFENPNMKNDALEYVKHEL